MKFSLFTFESKARTETVRPTLSGAAITSPRALPEHAGMLRQFQEMNGKMLRSYDAAMTNQFNGDFQSTPASANAEILTSLYLSRNRARTLVKDFSQGKAMQRTMQNNVVGHDPFRLNMKTGDGITDEEAQAIESEWHEAAKPENFSVRQTMSRMEGLRIMEASAFRDGSVLMRLYRGFPNNKYGFAVDLLEADRLQESYMGRAPDSGNVIRFSIELDKWNAPVAYWLLTRHPGDVFQSNGPWTGGVGAQVWRERVPANDIIHFNNLRDRAEQDIGFTELDCVIQDLHRARQYAISLAYAAIASCCKPFWVKKEYPTGMSYTSDDLEKMMNQAGAAGPVSGTGTGTGSEGVAGQQRIGARTNVVSPANTEIMNYGESLQQLDPKFPVEAAEDYQKSAMRSAGVGAGVAYQSISGDFQNMGFSASRMSELPQRDNFKVRQEHMKFMVIQRYFKEWLRYAIMSGALNLPIAKLDFYCSKAMFQGRRWAYVNPLQDVQSDIMAVENGFKSPQQVQSEMEDGMPLAELYDEFEKAKAMQEERDLVFGEAAKTQPTVAEPGSGAPAAPEDGKPPAKTGPAKTIKAHTNGHGRITVPDLILMQGDGR